MARGGGPPPPPPTPPHPTTITITLSHTHFTPERSLPHAARRPAPAPPPPTSAPPCGKAPLAGPPSLHCAARPPRPAVPTAPAGVWTDGWGGGRVGGGRVGVGGACPFSGAAAATSDLVWAGLGWTGRAAGLLRGQARPGQARPGQRAPAVDCTPCAAADAHASACRYLLPCCPTHAPLKKKWETPAPARSPAAGMRAARPWPRRCRAPARSGAVPHGPAWCARCARLQGGPRGGQGWGTRARGGLPSRSSRDRGRLRAGLYQPRRARREVLRAGGAGSERT